MAHSSLSHEILHRISALGLNELRVQEVTALLDFGLPTGLAGDGFGAVMSNGLSLAPTHPYALLLELAFVVEVLVRYALAWETCERYTWVVFRGGSNMDA